MALIHAQARYLRALDPPEATLGSSGDTARLCGAVGWLWEALAVLRRSLGRALGSSGAALGGYGGAPGDLGRAPGVPYIEKLPINRTSGRYVII